MHEKLEQIIKTAVEMFDHLGIRNVSMDDLAREMGISKKTLYLHVENKTDLLDKIFDFVSEVQKQMIYAALNDEMNAIDELIAVHRVIRDNSAKLQPQHKFELKKYYPQLFKKHMDKRRKTVYEDVRRNMQQGIEQGFYRQDLDVDLISHLYVQKMEDLHSSEYLQNCEFPKESFFEVMFDNHVRAIANSKGLKYYEDRLKEIKEKQQ